MSKVTKKTNFRVVVEPQMPRYSSYDEKYEESVCHNIRDEIRRHVDDVRQIWVEHDTDVTCSYCHLNWEEDADTKEPLCCQRAIDEFQQNKTPQP